METIALNDYQYEQSMSNVNVNDEINKKINLEGPEKNKSTIIKIDIYCIKNLTG